MATQASVAASAVGPSAISNAATAAGMGAQALFINPLTIGVIGGIIVGFGIFALRNRLQARHAD